MAWLRKKTRLENKRLKSGMLEHQLLDKKDQEILMEVHRLRLDVCAISETKLKGRRTTTYNNYILIYSGKGKDERTKSGVGIFIQEKYEQHITNIAYINDKSALQARLELQKKHIDIVSLYASDISKLKVEKKECYNQLEIQHEYLDNENQVYASTTWG